MFRLLALLVGTAAILSQGTPTPSGFGGRWRLADATVPPNVARELLVIEVPSSSVIGVDRRFEHGTEFANFKVIAQPGAVSPAPGQRTGGYWTAVLQRDRSLLLKAAAATQTSPGPFADHQETWVVDRDVLTVTVASKNAIDAPKVLRLTYQRIPRPRLVSADTNLLENGDGVRGRMWWSRVGEAVTEKCGGDPCFVVRNGGTLSQAVELPEDGEGRYLAIVGSAETDRINADGGITGLPSLYATVGSTDGARILAHLQGMLGRPRAVNEWHTVTGVFPIPKDAARLSVRLGQASARGVPHNGSAVRFDNVGVYIFSSESDARAFVSNWRGRTQ